MAVKEMVKETCKYPSCMKPARLAVRTLRPSRADMRLIIYCDNRTAPKTASRFCQVHGMRFIQELTEVLVDGDDDG